MATALYRRYRPETFSEMIGQQHVTEPLMAALRNGKVGHAYLFSGPRGCGKTTSARVLARCLNCAEGPTDTPCGKCESCVELSRGGGGSIDVVEIDAASHGGVDDARDLRERATYAPARDRYKIFIIDEAHMVTSAGFNALLKIVEEPPEYLKFIFATTEPEKVLGTIRSRTHHYPFRLIAPAVLGDYVEQLAASEGVAMEPGVLPLLVRAGGGSARDTLSILDQLIAGSDGDAVRLDRATALLGFTSAELIDDTINALAAGDGKAAFNVIDRVIQTGQDPRRFAEDLLIRLRDLIVVAATTVDGAAGVFRGVPLDALNRMFEQAQRFPAGALSRLADTISAGLDAMGGATAPRLQLELMIARALTAAPQSPAAQPQQGASRPQPQASAQVAPPAAPAAPTAAAPTPAPAAVQPAAPAAASEPAATPAPAMAEPAPAPAASNTTADLSALAQARAFLSAPAAPAENVRSQLQQEMDRISAAPPSTEFLREDADTVEQAGAPGSTTGAVAEPQANDSQQSEAVSAEALPNTAAEPEAQAAAPAGFEGTLAGDELLELWADVLEELGAGDPRVLAAAQQTVPLQLAGDLLTVGLRSAQDLQNFKELAANPVREALSGICGISVQFTPQKLPENYPTPTLPAAPAADDAEEPSPAVSPEPHSETEAEPAAVTVSEPEPTPQPEPAAAPGPAAGSLAEPEPEPESTAETPAVLQDIARPEAPAVPASSLPEIERYGEAVVRQVFNPVPLD